MVKQADFGSFSIGLRSPRSATLSGSAPITLRCYTHVLPGELERARDQKNMGRFSYEPGSRGGPRMARDGAFRAWEQA